MKSSENSNIDFQELGEGETEIASYQKEISGEQLETYIDDIADTVRVGLDQSISILTPWFFNNMPKIYYQTTPRQEKVRHLSAIITGHVFETKQTVELWDRDKSKVTYIGPGGDRKILVDMAKKISMQNIKMGGLYFSRDHLLFLSTFFSTGHKKLDFKNPRIAEKIKHARKIMLEEFPEKESSIDHYINNLDNDLVVYATAARLSITFRMVNHMLNHEGAHTTLDTFENSVTARLTLGLKNVAPGAMIEPILHLIHRYDFNVGRAFLVRIDQGYTESITVMHFIINHSSGEKVGKNFLPKIRLTKALRTLGWVDTDEFSIFSQKPYELSINATNFIRSLAIWNHLFLSKDNPYAYSLYRILNTFRNNFTISQHIVSLFRLRFDPLHEGDREADFANSLSQVEKMIDGLVEDIDRNIFKGSVRFIKYTLKTNYFHQTKTGLGFRIDPEILKKKYYPQKPFGIFFIIGRDFRYFHVRWRDVSRGGMRVVMPRNNADFELALAGLFDEVYGLSFAQQLKNKDIPEGGSKAVLVLKPGGHREHAVKGSVNAFLDMLVDDDEAHEGDTGRCVDYYGHQEIIYLGPDENMTNQLINWIPMQAKRRGYKYASAFMSSKPGEGINHKQYGVTSEGINVYIENTLNFLGIDPRKERFSVKMTGGPDGDVAGNELKILHREYGENARIISISDGMGCAYDENGLDWPELMRLVAANQSIIHFSPKKLSNPSSKKSFILEADTNPNIKIRNEIFMKTYADIFVPAGGRPYTVNDKNWKLFLDEIDKPTMKAVVEGANIFFTQTAREKLQELGVVIVKDSSANKTGVICSSFEIIGSLSLKKEEFLSIKDTYVEQVLGILRQKADAEAKLLFKAYAYFGGKKSFVELSLEISKEINEITDLVQEGISRDKEKVLTDPFYLDMVLRYCPEILRTKFKDQVLAGLPDTYKLAVIAASVASYVVYREGLGWLQNIPKSHWVSALNTYMKKVNLTAELIEKVMKSDLPDKNQINSILEKSAARDLTMIELEKNLIV